MPVSCQLVEYFENRGRGDRLPPPPPSPLDLIPSILLGLTEPNQTVSKQHSEAQQGTTRQNRHHNTTHHIVSPLKATQHNTPHNAMLNPKRPKPKKSEQSDPDPPLLTPFIGLT